MTPRQRQAARLRASGLTWAQVGERMGLDPQTAQQRGDARIRRRHREMIRILRPVWAIEAATWIADTWDAAETARVAR